MPDDFEPKVKKSKAIVEMNDKLLKSKKELEKLKADLPKVCLLLIGFLFVLPYIPLRRGQLVEQYGYLNSIIYIAIGYILILPITYISVRNTMINKISNLERDIEQQKRLDKLKE